MCQIKSLCVTLGDMLQYVQCIITVEYVDIATVS